MAATFDGMGVDGCLEVSALTPKYLDRPSRLGDHLVNTIILLLLVLLCMLSYFVLCCNYDRAGAPRALVLIFHSVSLERIFRISDSVLVRPLTLRIMTNHVCLVDHVIQYRRVLHG